MWGVSYDSEILLGVGGFNMDKGEELTMIDADIEIQKGNTGGVSVPGEVDRIATVELFQEISEGVRPKGPRAEFIWLGVKEIVFEVAHE